MKFLYLEVRKIAKYVSTASLNLILHILKGYQRYISPILGNNCRFYPSCSNYAAKAFESYGVFRGTILVVNRLAKCHPFHAGGLDEVPNKKISSMNCEAQK